MICTISSSRMTVAVNTKGALIESIVDLEKQKELVWQKEENVWNRSDILMFPMIGKGFMVLSGEKRRFPQPHGCLYNMDFRVTEQDESHVRLETSWSQETYHYYPYRFHFAAEFTARDHRLIQCWEVWCEEGSMPFQVGSHLGLRVRNGKGRIRFSTAENVYHYQPKQGNYIPDRQTYRNVTSISFDKALFQEQKSVVLGNIQSGEVRLEDEDGPVCSYLGDNPILSLWSNDERGDFVCLETMWGIPTNDSGIPFEKMPFINIATSDASLFYHELVLP